MQTDGTGGPGAKGALFGGVFARRRPIPRVQRTRAQNRRLQVGEGGVRPRPSHRRLDVVGNGAEVGRPVASARLQQRPARPGVAVHLVRDGADVEHQTVPRPCRARAVGVSAQHHLGLQGLDDGPQLARVARPGTPRPRTPTAAISRRNSACRDRPAPGRPRTSPSAAGRPAGPSLRRSAASPETPENVCPTRRGARRATASRRCCRAPPRRSGRPEVHKRRRGRRCPRSGRPS